MTERISLAEAYNNKDVITQIAILKDKLDSIPDADLTNVVLKTGDQIIDGEKTFNDPIVANGGVNFANSGIHVNGTLEVDGDIIQNGSAYETHAEQVFSKNDLIVTREDAIGGIASRQLSGIRVKKYNGVDDLNLGVDNLGVMRVGDLGDEQPLATRDEASDMTSGALVKWDGMNKKMIAPPSNIGSDTKPIKIVNGEEIPVTNDLLYELMKTNAATGGVKLSNGLIINWGITSALSIAAGTGGNADFDFAIPFTSNASYQLTANLAASPTYFGQIVFATFTSSNSCGRITYFNGAAAAVNMPFRYIAIGF